MNTTWMEQFYTLCTIHSKIVMVVLVLAGIMLRSLYEAGAWASQTRRPWWKFFTK